MKRIFLRMLLVGIIATFSSVVVDAADDVPLSIQYDYNNSEVKIMGEIEGADDYVSIQILNPGKEIDSFEDQDVLYRNQTGIENKRFSFVIGYSLEQGEYDTYNAYLKTSRNTEPIRTELYLVPYDDYEGFYDDLNLAAAASDEDEFKKIVNERRIMADFDNKLTKERDLTTWLEDYYTYVKNNVLDKTKNYDNKEIFLAYMTAAALNDKVIVNLDLYIEDLTVIDSEIIQKYKDVADTEEIQQYFTQKLSGRNIKDIENFEKEFKKALVLTGIRYADGYGEVKELINTYGDVFGITKTVENSVYKALSGNDYTQKNFYSAFETLVTPQSKPMGGSNGGGQTGNGNFAITGGNTQPEILGMPILFEDIDGVGWASEAILALADKNIINGKEPGKFKPDDEITREEFVKILIGAMGYADKSYSDFGFVDVKENDWFFKYVNIAAENGIVQGIGNGYFGTGNLITRQDLATMIYNALKMKSIALETNSPDFDDIGDIDEYALEAVAALYEIGAVNGVSADRFAPKENATRAQAAKIIYGVLEMFQ